MNSEWKIKHREKRLEKALKWKDKKKQKTNFYRYPERIIYLTNSSLTSSHLKWSINLFILLTTNCTETNTRKKRNVFWEISIAFFLTLSSEIQEDPIIYWKFGMEKPHYQRCKRKKLSSFFSTDVKELIDRSDFSKMTRN